MLANAEKMALFKEVPLFKGISEDSFLEQLIPSLEEKNVSANERIITKGEFGNTMYIIAHGKFKVHIEEISLAVLGKGDIFGEMGALVPQVRIASVTALEPSLLLAISHDTLYDIIAKQKSFTKGIIELLCERARDNFFLQQQLIVQEKFASLGLLSSGFAHELKNPLNFVINFSALARDLLADLEENVKDKTSIESKEMGNGVQQKIASLTDLINKIMQYSKRADNIVNRLLQQVLQTKSITDFPSLKIMLQQSINLTLHEFHKHDPQFDVDIEIKGDPSAELSKFSSGLTGAFNNILDNAFYAMNERQKDNATFEPQLKIILQGREQDIVINFIDNGGGISPDILPHVFEPFFTTKSSGTGSGLGLYIARAIITQLHKGTLDITSDFHHSTTVTITLSTAQKHFKG